MRIPRTLQAGDKLWYSDTEYAVAANYLSNTPYFSSGEIYTEHPQKKYMFVYNRRGAEIDGETPCIIRVERVTSHKPAKPLRQGINTSTPLRVKKALRIIERYGQIDGAHHKAWCRDQIARALLGLDYGAWVANMKKDGYDEGIAP